MRPESIEIMAKMRLETRCHDSEAITQRETQRRVSLDPTGFQVCAKRDTEQCLHPHLTLSCSCASTSQIVSSDSDENVAEPSFSFRKLWAFSGPGLLMSVGYLDPGNIGADLQSAAAAKYQLLWILMWSTIAGLLMQRLAARLATVSGQHLSEACFTNFPIVPRIILWLLAELAVIGAEIQEVVGSAIALYLLSNATIPLWAGVLLALTQSFFLLLLDQYGRRRMEAVFAIMIAVMAISFGYQYATAGPDPLEVIDGMLFPACQNCHKSAYIQGIGIIGAVILPHNLFLHSALVKSKKVDRTQENKVKEANNYFFLEATITLGIAFVLNLFIISVFADGLWEGSVRKSTSAIVQTCPPLQSVVNNASGADSYFELNLYTSGIFLGCQYGQLAMYIWAIGLLAAGQSSTMTAVYAGQFIMEGFLNIKLPHWKRVLITRLFVLIPPLVVALFLEISHLSEMNDLINASMSLLLPFSVIPLVAITTKSEVMGNIKNGWFTNIFCGALVVFLILANLYFICVFFVDLIPLQPEWLSGTVEIIFVFLYLSLCTFIFVHVLISLGLFVPPVSKVSIIALINIFIILLTYWITQS